TASVVLGVPLNAAFHPIYLKAASDVNHGIASMGSVTNFTALTPPDGPMLWGYDGGVLALMNPTPKIALTWTATGVGIGTTNPISRLQVVGTITDTNFSGNGSALTNIPLSGLQTLPLTNNQTGVTLNGAFTGTHNGNGGG